MWRKEIGERTRSEIYNWVYAAPGKEIELKENRGIGNRVNRCWRNRKGSEMREDKRDEKKEIRERKKQ